MAQPVQVSPQAASLNPPTSAEALVNGTTRSYMMPTQTSQFTYVTPGNYKAQAAGTAPPVIDVTQQVMAESAAPRGAQFRKATDAGFVWNDQALADYGFNPEEIAHLKSRGLEDGSMDYFMEQGWLSPATSKPPIDPPEIPKPPAPPPYQPLIDPSKPFSLDVPGYQPQASPDVALSTPQRIQRDPNTLLGFLQQRGIF